MATAIIPIATNQAICPHVIGPSFAFRQLRLVISRGSILCIWSTVRKGADNGLHWGVVLLAVAVAMLVVGRGGRDGEPRAFLSNWLISTIYSVAILIIFVAGAGVILLNWPF
jgi:uncharacterized membrane protein (DUF441 family)